MTSQYDEHLAIVSEALADLKVWALDTNQIEEAEAISNLTENGDPEFWPMALDILTHYAEWEENTAGSVSEATAWLITIAEEYA